MSKFFGPDGKGQEVMEDARGYRNMDNFIATIYLRNGRLQMEFD